MLKKISDCLTTRKLPFVVAVTHLDDLPTHAIEPYRNYIKSNPAPFAWNKPAIFRMDARLKQDVKCVVTAIAAILEMQSRFPELGAK